MWEAYTKMPLTLSYGGGLRTCNALSSAFSNSTTSSAPASMACSTAVSNGVFSCGMASIKPLWSNNPGIAPSVNVELSEY